MQPKGDTLSELVRSTIGARVSVEILDIMAIDPALTGHGDHPSRGTIAMAMNLVLMHRFLARVPTGASYVADQRRDEKHITFDHGALRTIRFAERPTGALPGGEDAFKRILEPLGYRMTGLFPLPRLKMNGYGYTHLDHPATIPQFFISELQVDRFSPLFGKTAACVFDSSRDVLTHEAIALLDVLAVRDSAPLALAMAGLPALVAAFDRQHDTPDYDDYRTLLAESAEAGWIATEGNTLSHFAVRVPDLAVLAAEQTALGRPVKGAFEISVSGGVRQTAFAPDPVERQFNSALGDGISAIVPGSFFEFISRDTITGADGAVGLDLGFDGANSLGLVKIDAIEG